MGMGKHGVLVKYMGGFAGYPPKSIWSTTTWELACTPEGFQAIHGKQHPLLPTYRYTLVRHEPWAPPFRLVIEPSGQRQINPLAIAAFGVLGLGAGANTALITAQYPDGDAFFTSVPGVDQWITALSPLMRQHPGARASIHFGPLDPDQRWAPAQQSAHPPIEDARASAPAVVPGEPASPSATAIAAAPDDGRLTPAAYGSHLRALHELLESGVLTADEYQAKKQELLARI